MSDSNLFGRIVSPGMVERAVVASLELWADTYLGEIERLEGYLPNQIERPRGIVTASEFEKWPEDQIPVILVINTGLANVPTRRHDGTYDAAWLVGIAPIVSDTDEVSTRTLVNAYVTAIRAALLQHKMLKSSLYPAGFAESTVWRDENYTDLPFLQSRSLAAARVTLEVGVQAVLTEQAGPRTPLADPAQDPGPWPSQTVPPKAIIENLSPLEPVT